MFTGMKGWSPQNSLPNSITGTPATVNKKSEEPTDEEMLEKVQHMIHLQEAAQDPLPEIRTPPQKIPNLPVGTVAGASITPAAAAEARAAAAGGAFATTTMNTTTAYEKPPPAPRPPPPPPPPLSNTIPQSKGRSIMGSIPYQDYSATSGYARETTTAPPQPNMEGVGQGRMYFPGEYTQQSLLEEQHPMLGDGGGGGGSIPHYGGAAGSMNHHHDVNMMDHVVDPDFVEPAKHHHHHHNTTCACFSKCVQHWKNAESLHQSFCFGSIDGMLTGAGIVATFLGTGVLTPRASLNMHLFVVVFSLAACTSDAICMAVGHVWSTYVLTNASANERRTERLSFESSRADAKGKLVEMLLSRGMLKIDAMSIADTLEGYPDIFVSALVGDSGYTLGDESLALSSSSSNGQLVGLGLGPEETTFSPLLRARRSYGQLNDFELDPEAASVKAALGESRKEGFIMMLGFALFSVVPSLIFLWLSHIMNVSVKHRASGGTSVTSIAVSLTSLVMLLLGFWKSRFFHDSHWVLFGIETVVVLWMCTLSAYFIGFGLVMGIPGLRGILQDDGGAL